VTAAPRPFGKYLLDREIARGGMARVHLARLRGLGGFEKRLVVKQILPELAQDPRFITMFVEEAKTVVQMSHPNIAPVYELGVVDGVYFLAMEYVEGATLSAILRQGGPLHPTLAALVGVEVCDALHYAHQRFGVVHRDVTPRNVIIDGDGHSRLLDFGIAAPAEGDDGEVFGTPGYLPPEALRGEAIGPAADLFMVGVVLYEALTGRRAFVGRTVEATRPAVLDGDGPTFEAADAVPGDLQELVRRCLAREPEARPSSADAVGRALRGWLAAARPEGVAPELGQRAEAATRSTEIALGGGDDDVEDEPAQVQTLAASRAFETLLTEATRPLEPAEEAPEDEEGSSPPDAAAAAGHAPEVPRGDPTPATVRRPRRDPTPATVRAAPTIEAPETTPPDATPEAAGRRARLPYLLAVALAGLVALFGVIVALQPGPAAPAVRVPVEAATPPPEVAPETVAATPDPEPAPEPLPEPEAPPPRRPTRPAPAARHLTVNAVPWAEVELDGRRLGPTPVRRAEVRPGRRSLVLRCPPLGAEASTHFDVPADRDVTIFADLSADPPRIRVR
jgi:hypothetical protein